MRRRSRNIPRQPVVTTPILGVRPRPPCSVPPCHFEQSEKSAFRTFFRNPGETPPLVIVSEAPDQSFLCDTVGRAVERSMHLLFIHKIDSSRRRSPLFSFGNVGNFGNPHLPLPIPVIPRFKGLSPNHPTGSSPTQS